jgi:Family of unknown function (DUF5367)
MERRFVASGLVLWAVGTVILRLGGHWLLPPTAGPATVVLFAVSFVVFAVVARQMCGRLDDDRWLAAGVSLVMPTLVLDPFSAAFFPVVFPNIPAGAAGVFGGWMLACCGGALAGVLVGRRGDRPG